MGSFFIYSCGWFMTHDFPDIFSCTSKQLLSLESHFATYQSSSFAGTTWMDTCWLLTWIFLCIVL